ncbi:aldo/keto reductase [Sphingobacterium sp. SG20118]|uniref:aldo/keto reductase n=1 Tax=Sphingobacterium sp. SG20118 TaxID=3367156 RepID=UPI0037DFC2D5
MDNKIFKTELQHKDNGNESNRRNFLKNAALLGAGMSILPLVTKASSSGDRSQMNTVTTDNKDFSPTKITTRRTLGSGNSSMEISTLGFGVMGMNHHRGYHPDRKAMIKLLHQAVDQGVTLFDTAETYGPFINEELAGEGLYPYRNKVAIATKFGHQFVNGKHTGELNSRPEHIRKVAEDSLKRLRVDTIELFYQHRLDPKVPIEDVAGAVKDLIKEGKVRRFGVCEVSAQTIRRAHTVQPLTAVQSEYHLMWREPEKEILPVLEELGIGFVPYSPINRGFLGGDFNEHTRFNSGNDNREILPRFTPEALRANLAFVEVLNRFGKTRGMTSAQISLAWLLNQKPWIVPIPGTTKFAHLAENMRSLDFTITPDEWHELESALSKITIIGDRYPAVLQNNVQN